MPKTSLLTCLSLIATTGLAYAADEGKIGAMTAANQMEWREIGPGSPVKLVILWGDRSKGEYAMLLKLPAGFVAPIHAHTGDYHGMNLTASLL